MRFGEIKVNDCVVYESLDGKKGLGRIQRLEEGFGGMMVVKVDWLVTPPETVLKQEIIVLRGVFPKFFRVVSEEELSVIMLTEF